MEELKRILHSLNDIRVLTNSIYAREYLNHSKSHNTFLRTLVTMLIDSMSPSGVSQIQTPTNYPTIVRLC
jgi:hypothetical protein